MRLLRLLVITLQPVAEALPVERVSLGEDTGVVERVRARVADALHLEGHPAAVARAVVQELLVVARAAA